MKNNELEYQASEISRILDSGIEILPNSPIHLKLKKALTFCKVIRQSEQLVCEHKYKDNVCDWRGVRKCLVCGKMEEAN